MSFHAIAARLQSEYLTLTSKHKVVDNCKTAVPARSVCKNCDLLICAIGRFNPARAGVVAAPGTIQTSSSSFEGSAVPTYLEDGSAAYSEGASNAPPEGPSMSSGGHGFCNGHC